MNKLCGAPLVSVVMPVFNEVATIEQIVDRVLAVPLPKELIIVDDGSTDGTQAWLKKRFNSQPVSAQPERVALFSLALQGPQVKVLFQSSNMGKGAALRRGFGEAKGDFIVVQDADLEYDPQDYPRIIEPILADQADVVYGSRFLGQKRAGWPLLGYLGNKVVTRLVNAMTGLSLTDVWTGYKVFHQRVLEGMVLRESGFELEIELTAKIAQRKWRICEVPISYDPRTRAQGKKIRWVDGMKGLLCAIKYRNPR